MKSAHRRLAAATESAGLHKPAAPGGGRVGAVAESLEALSARGANWRTSGARALAYRQNWPPAILPHVSRHYVYTQTESTGSLLSGAACIFINDLAHFFES